jgi:hypothetical protein
MRISSGLTAEQLATRRQLIAEIAKRRNPQAQQSTVAVKPVTEVISIPPIPDRRRRRQTVFDRGIGGGRIYY